MERRKAIDIMAGCIVEIVHEYKQVIEKLNKRIEILETSVNYWRGKTHDSVVDDCNKATDTLGEIADIIAGITEHTEEGDIRIYLSTIVPEDERKLKKLFKLLDIPMTDKDIKEEGDSID